MEYSVFVPFVEIDGKLNLLFEVRSLGLARQPGDICFPGGKIEAGETGEECAVREAAEELGVSRDAIRIIQQLDSIYTHDGFPLHSFYGEIAYDKLSESKINHREVESIFYVPASYFLNRERREESSYRYGDKNIWGLTARIIHNLVKILQ